MNNRKQSVWKAIEGFHATQYMLIMVVSMAISVIFTRVYLEVTGYPQLGNDTFHIAHALWGGLLQAAAAILMLIYLNRWVFMLSASLAGIGAGLFVDEIGKFITQTNDYFFPLAAPLIYVTVILMVMLYLYIHQDDDHDARGNMYIVLDNLKPLLDQHMNRHDFEVLQSQLHELTNQTERSDIADIAQALIQALPADSSMLPVPNPNPIDRMIDRLKQIEEKYFSQSIIRRLLMLFFAISGASSLGLVGLLASILTNSSNLESFIINVIIQNDSMINSPNSLNWYLAFIVVTTVVGFLYLITFALLIKQRDQVATQVAIVALVIALTVGNTMSFYFNQFSVMLTSVGLFGLLLMVIRYRGRFLQDSES